MKSVFFFILINISSTLLGQNFDINVLYDNSKLLREPIPWGECIKYLPKNSIIKVLDYKDDYILAVSTPDTGWINKMNITQNDELKGFVEYKLYLVDSTQKSINETLLKIEQEAMQKEKSNKDSLSVSLNIKRKQEIFKKYEKAVANKLYAGKVWFGMTKEMAQDSWGTPIKKNISESNTLKNEEWIYLNDKYLYFKNGKLDSFKYSE